jgi:hypothetical protein
MRNPEVALAGIKLRSVAEHRVGGPQLDHTEAIGAVLRTPLRNGFHAQVRKSRAKTEGCEERRSGQRTSAEAWVRRASPEARAAATPWQRVVICYPQPPCFAATGPSIGQIVLFASIMPRSVDANGTAAGGWRKACCSPGRGTSAGVLRASHGLGGGGFSFLCGLYCKTCDTQFAA